MDVELTSKGYVLFRNVLSDKDIASGLSCIDGSVMDYVLMDRFIKTTLLKIPRDLLGWDTSANVDVSSTDTFTSKQDTSTTADVDTSKESKKIKDFNTYTKYRFSNNNNNDAVAFHRDVIPCSHLKKEMPIYTVLTYFDTSTMELIPGSHLDTCIGYIDTMKNLNRIVSLQINPKDVLVFNSLLLHRGVFDSKQTSRRLLQVFECYPDVQTRDLYSLRILHVPGTVKNFSIMDSIKRMVVVGDLVNLVGYINASTGYGVDGRYIDATDTVLDVVSDVVSRRYPSFYSSEGFSSRFHSSKHNINVINLYYINIPINDLENTRAEEFLYNFYTRNFIRIVLYMLIVIALVVSIAMYVYRRLDR